MDRAGDIFISGNGTKPWDEGLLAATRAAEARLELARREYGLLLVENRKLKHQLAEARRRLENWKVRQEAWRRERAGLTQEQANRAWSNRRW